MQWQKTPNTPESDGFEIKQADSSNPTLKIMLHLDTGNELHKLSPPLTNLLGTQVDTLPNMIMHLWQYVKVHKLLDNEDKRFIICDEKMQQIFGAPKIMFAQVHEIIARHLLPLDPVVLNYTVRWIGLI